MRVGQRVLIHAAAGGLGHVAVQIAKAYGAYVIGTARTGNHEFLRDHGADELIDYTAVDFTDTIRDVDIALTPSVAITAHDRSKSCGLSEGRLPMQLCGQRCRVQRLTCSHNGLNQVIRNQSQRLQSE
jgi:NADPH:quinone reductase-like Zn-dependent oxidoreductase